MLHGYFGNSPTCLLYIFYTRIDFKEDFPYFVIL